MLVLVSGLSVLCKEVPAEAVFMEIKISKEKMLHGKDDGPLSKERKIIYR